MSDIVAKYLNDIIPNDLSGNKSYNELLNIMISTGLGNKMINYVQKLRIAIEKRGRLGTQCKVNINWTPQTKPQQLSCVWDKVILGGISNSIFGLYVNIYGKFLTQRKLYYSKRAKNLSARP